MEPRPSFYKLTEGINLDNIAYLLDQHGERQPAKDVRLLILRIDKLNHVAPVIASQIDIEEYLAWDIIRVVRDILDCPPEEALVHHCEKIANMFRTEEDKNA